SVGAFDNSTPLGYIDVIRVLSCRLILVKGKRPIYAVKYPGRQFGPGIFCVPRGRRRGAPPARGHTARHVGSDLLEQGCEEAVLRDGTSGVRRGRAGRRRGDRRAG